MQEDIVINDIVVEEQIQIATRIGVDGVTFTPHIEEVSSSETILSFTNDGERDNPEPTNIKGEAFTYEDFTPEQITALQQPALDAAVIATNAANSALEAEEIIQDNEDIRIASELSRVSAETTRNNREIIRNNNELGRVSAEESRVTNEGLRASAEEGRVNTEIIRVSSEQTRALNEISRNNAEILRESNEDTRKENELTRISSENTRLNNEVSRQNAEVIRSSNEVNRINAELLRNSNESTRGINEGIRQDNEVTRIANENIRIVNEGDEASGRVKAELDRVAAEAVREVIKDSMIELNENPPKLFEVDDRLVWHYWNLSTHAYVSSGLSGALSWRGVYVAGSTYIPLDVVSYNESTWLCITESTGNLPTTAYFVPLAKGSYQYWLEAGNTGTYEEYLLWLDSKEDVINKKQTVTNSETDYPSGKAVYDELAALRHDQLRDPNGDPNYQHITTGAQTFTGVKTFSSSPIIPIPTTDYQGAPKKYVADQDALKLNKTAVDVYNVTLAVPLTAGQYYTPTTARAAVPEGVRKRGLLITYETAAGIWNTEKFKGVATATWATTADWEIIYSQKNIEDVELTSAEALNVLYNRITALEKFIAAMVVNTMQADTINIIKSFNLFGDSNMILVRAVAPAVVPDFVGQRYVNTAAKTKYTAAGVSSVADWVQD